MKDRRSLAVAVVSALVIIGVIVWAIVASHHPTPQEQNASSAPSSNQLAVGDTAPEFKIPSTSGLFDLDAQTKPVFVEVFASWCPHCQHETSVLNPLYEHFKNRIAFIAVPGSATGMDGNSPESEADLFNFMSRFHVQYPVAVFDPSLTAANLYLQGGYPTIAVVGTNKKITYIGTGEVPYATLATALEHTH